MTVQPINIGNVVNDGLGDDLRTAFEKVNANFAELSISLNVTAENLSNVGEPILVSNTTNNNLNLQFKTLLAGSKITLDGTESSIIVNSTLSDAFTTIATDVDVIDAETNPNITIQGTENISVSGVGSTITIDVTPLFDFGIINANIINPIQLALIAANIDFGTISNPSDFNLDFGLI